MSRARTKSSGSTAAGILRSVLRVYSRLFARSTTAAMSRVLASSTQQQRKFRGSWTKTQAFKQGYLSTNSIPAEAFPAITCQSEACDMNTGRKLFDQGRHYDVIHY